MIELHQYRITVGTFCQSATKTKNLKNTKKIKNQKNTKKIKKHKMKKNKIDWKISLMLLIPLLISDMYLNSTESVANFSSMVSSKVNTKTNLSLKSLTTTFTSKPKNEINFSCIPCWRSNRRKYLVCIKPCKK